MIFNDVLTFELADVSQMPIFNDFDKTLTSGKHKFHVRIIDDLSMLIIDSGTADNHESTLGTGTNYLENDTGDNTHLNSGHVGRVFGLFGNSTDTVNLTSIIRALIVIINSVLRMNYFLIVV